MYPTELLARVFGIYAIAIGIGMFVNPIRFKDLQKRFLGDDALTLLGGVIALLLGAFMISVHNFWVLGWPVIITILGWWSAIKGVGIIVFPGFPELFRPLTQQSPTAYRIGGVVWGLVGLWLFWQGWM